MKRLFHVVTMLVCLILLLGNAASATPHFLTLPFADRNCRLQQGWTYTDGGKHEGMDYVKGTVDNSNTWQAFTACAAANGQAIYRPGYNGGLGNYVSVLHVADGQTYYTFYCHLADSPIPVDRRMDVVRGQALGTTGITGDANGVNHLHFEVHQSNESISSRVDPYDLYKRRSDYPPYSGKGCGVNYLWTIDPPVPSLGQRPGDYDGDGKTDMATWRPSTGTWFILPSSGSGGYAMGLGQQGDIPVTSDYDGDGKIDMAVFRPSEGKWYILWSSGGGTSVGFGNPGDIPVPGDYDGDGKTDIGVWRPSEGKWYIILSGGGTRVQGFGQAGDVPVSGYLIR